MLKRGSLPEQEVPAASPSAQDAGLEGRAVARIPGLLPRPVSARCLTLWASQTEVLILKVRRG